MIFLYNYVSKNISFYRIIVFIFFIIFTIFSCRKQNPNTPNKITKENNITCLYSNYFYLLTKKEEIKDDKINSFFEMLEEHEFNNIGSETSNKNCKKICSDDNINSVYESLLALYILKNDVLNKQFALINNKIMDAMKLPEGLGKNNFYASLDKWLSLDDSNIVFPSLQRQSFYPDPSLPSTVTKKETLKYAIGLSIEVNGKKIRNPNPNSALQFDFILFNAKGFDGIGSKGKRGSTYTPEREYYYDTFLKRIRGHRGTLIHSKKSDYHGISHFKIEELKAQEGSLPWKNQSRDTCVVSRKNSLYTDSIEELKIPLACGVSGTTNLALSPIFAYRTKLNENEVRLFILLDWAVLSYDTGHSLQEVLTAAKLLSIYLKGIFENKDPAFQEIRRNNISRTTIQALEKVTAPIRPLSDNNEKFDLEKWNLLHEQLFKYNHVVSNPNALKKEEDAPNPTSVYSDPNSNQCYDAPRYFKCAKVKGDLKREELDESEKQIRRDIEYYFNQYDLKYSTGAKFGKYNSSFFIKFNSPEIEEAREMAKENFIKFFKRSCNKKD